MVENRDDGQLELSLRLGQNPSNMITNSKKVHDHRNPIWNRPVLQSQGYHDIANVNSSKAEKFPLRGVDMNWTPPPVEWEEGSVDGGGGPQLSPPDSTVSSLSGKRIEREVRKALSSPGSCNDDFGGGGAAYEEEETASAKKKLRLSKEQTGVLEGTFKTHTTINPKQKVTLALQLNLSPRQVEVWFQNRRARTKLKQAEVDCQYLKRCCEKLSEENKRLHKEVQELRALKHSPHHLCMHMPPATTIAMCPSCDRGRAASSAPSSSSDAAVTTATDRCNQLLLGQGYTRSTPIRSSWGGPINLYSHDVHGL